MFCISENDSSVARVSGGHSKRLLGHPALQKFDWPCMDEREWSLLMHTWHATWGQAARAVFPDADRQHFPALAQSADHLRRLPAGGTLEVALHLREASGRAQSNSLTTWLAIALKADHRLELSFCLARGDDRDSAANLKLSSDWSEPFCGSRTLLKTIPTIGLGHAGSVAAASAAVLGALADTKLAFGVPS